MTNELIDLVSHELFLFVAFMCGLILGYMIGKRENQDL